MYLFIFDFSWFIRNRTLKQKASTKNKLPTSKNIRLKKILAAGDFFTVLTRKNCLYVRNPSQINSLPAQEILSFQNISYDFEMILLVSNYQSQNIELNCKTAQYQLSHKLGKAANLILEFSYLKSRHSKLFWRVVQT